MKICSLTLNHLGCQDTIRIQYLLLTLILKPEFTVPIHCPSVPLPSTKVTILKIRLFPLPLWGYAYAFLCMCIGTHICIYNFRHLGKYDIHGCIFIYLYSSIFIWLSLISFHISVCRSTSSPSTTD